jgi:hypothetical protein
VKKHRLFLSAVSIAAALALFATGCSLGSGTNTGSIRFAFSPAARALSAGQSYRVEVYYGSDLYTSSDFLPDVPVVLDLPTGQATVYVAQGSGSGDAFVATKFGSFDITIVAGDNAAGPITLADVPFHMAPNVTGVSSVAALAGQAYAATAAGLKLASYGTGGFTVTDGPTVPTGVTVTSLSVAPYFSGTAGFDSQVWVNGTWSPDAGGGIMPWVGTALDTTLTGGFGVAANWSGTPAAFTVQGSGSFTVTGPTAADDGLAIFYNRNGGIGGVYVKRSEIGAKATWPWIMDQIDLTAALGGTVPAGHEPVLDFVTSKDALYLVTAFTTLKMSQGVLTAGIDAQSLLDSTFVSFATGIPASIISIAVHESDAGTGTVYLGTESGLWTGATSSVAGSFFTGNPTLVSGTSGYAIRKIVVSPAGAHVAVISSRGEGADYLVVDGTVYRTLQGLPGTSLTSLAWLDDTTLLVAGSSGLAALNVP